jgi:hypothetical protein
MRIFAVLCFAVAQIGFHSPARADDLAKTALDSPLCQIPVGTILIVETTQAVNSETAVTGSKYSIRLAEPIKIDGKILVDSGVMGVGDIIHAQRRQAFSGRAGELIIAARYLEANGVRLKLGKSNIEIAGEQSRGFVFNGGSVAPTISSEATEIPIGTFTEAEVVSECAVIADEIQSNSLKNIAELEKPAAILPQISNSLQTEPVAGLGRLIVYRVAYHADGYGSSCKVRTSRDGTEQLLPNLKGNTYLVYDALPGLHQFSVKLETTDRLTMEIVEGQTKYLQCVMTTGILRARPDIRPSSQPEFASFPKLKPLHLNIAAPSNRK